MIQLHEAYQIINRETKPLGTEKVQLEDCFGRVLAEDIVASESIPSFAKSAMDGYALNSQETVHMKTFEVKGLIKAGDAQAIQLNPGEAYKIMTGAPLPQGSNAVIEVEIVQNVGNTILIPDAVRQGNHVIQVGEEIEEGQIALRKGNVLRPAEIGLLAALGYPCVSVSKKPVVSFICTGDELISVSEPLSFGKVRNSNTYSLEALLKSNGAVLHQSIISEDKPERLRACMDQVLEASDVIITSGGASVGEYDFAEQVLESLGANIHFSRVGIKPGKPTIFATLGRKLLFALPGNPMSMITTFEEFVKLAFQKMEGRDMKQPDTFPVILAQDFHAKPGRKKFIYSKLSREGNGIYAYHIGAQCSNHLLTMTKANGVILLPEECGLMKKGMIVEGKYLFERT